ncbi:hypothetical protein DICVIV_07012 [Dictyocaulus viviparus]|uniref:Uncharacterized protein n=1 Tax=Dictyocaulus viviparus TaxID=29172 RepID=A0A0D8XSZ5_DICVI|nr:hypothetical protein DICVIV_07012 [Dictyocaulus viviparus]
MPMISLYLHVSERNLVTFSWIDVNLFCVLIEYISDELHYQSNFDSVILSVTICDAFAFVYCLDRIGTLLDVANRAVLATFNFAHILEHNGMSSQVRMSTATITSLGEKLFIALGTVSGHIFFTDFAPSSFNTPMKTCHEVSMYNFRT